MWYDYRTMKEQIEARFWADVQRRFNAKVKKAEGACWNWTGAKNDKGYGTVQVYGFKMYAHRLSLVLVGRDIPQGRKEVVRHTCDNPACVNPDHLQVGTQAENMADMIRKGRQCFPGCGGLNGESNPAATITKETAKAIRDQYSQAEGYRKLATRFGISKTQAYRIVKSRSWQ